MKKRNTIKKYREFKEILDLRKFKRNAIFTIYFRKNDYGHTRIGLLVTKKNGNAVIRNKIKRQVRSIIEQTISYKENIDLIIVISKKYDVNEFSKNQDLLISLIHDII